MTASNFMSRGRKDPIMSLKISADALQKTISGYLEQYGEEVSAAIEAASKATAKDVVKDLRRGGGYRGGEKFNKGWTSKTEAGRLGTSTTVYNSTQPGLAHLLEFGHAKRNGGRTRAFNFIAPVADSVEQKFESAFEKALNK